MSEGEYLILEQSKGWDFQRVRSMMEFAIEELKKNPRLIVALAKHKELRRVQKWSGGKWETEYFSLYIYHKNVKVIIETNWIIKAWTYYSHITAMIKDEEARNALDRIHKLLEKGEF